MSFIVHARYLPNCYNHTNDNYYHLRTSQECYSKDKTEDEIEASIQSFFPIVWVDFCGVLYIFTNMQTQIFRAFNIWLSWYSL